MDESFKPDELKVDTLLCANNTILETFGDKDLSWDITLGKIIKCEFRCAENLPFNIIGIDCITENNLLIDIKNDFLAMGNLENERKRLLKFMSKIIFQKK